MEELNELAKQIAANDPIGIKLDNTVKSLFAYKPLLSRVIKETVTECKDMTYEEIEACIEGEIRISKQVVNPGLSKITERIHKLNNEMYLNDEGLVTFDLYTYLKIPSDNDENIIKIYFNLEFMNEDKPGYDISLRALFYCCRMISMQEGIEFTTHKDDPIKYGNIKKVYSIWICTESAQKRANTIEKYAISRSFLLGENCDSPRYDIINAVIIYISKTHDTEETDNELIKMLNVLFNEKIMGTEKITKLQKEHGVPMTREIGKEVPGMCTYAEAMVKKGLEQGFEQAQEEIEKERQRANDAETKLNNTEAQLNDARTYRKELEEKLLAQSKQDES